MERKYTMYKGLAAIIIDRIYEDNLPIEVHTGNEHTDGNGDRQVDILLEYEDADLVSDVLDDSINSLII